MGGGGALLELDQEEMIETRRLMHSGGSPQQPPVSYIARPSPLPMPKIDLHPMSKCTD